MRSAAIFALLGIGAFAVATGLVLQHYTYPTLARVQHNIDMVSVSEGEGVTALVYPPGATLPELRHDLKLTATTHVEGDLAQPEVQEGSDVTVWKRSTIVKDDVEGLTLSAEVRRMCLDRRTGEAVAPCHGQFYETELDKRTTAQGDELLHPGLSFVFPFDTQKRDYLWYDTVLGKPLFVGFDGEERLHDLDVYRFVHELPPTRIGKFAVPGSLIGRPGEPSVEVAQYYEVTRTLHVEPTTGAVLSVREDVRQELRAPDQTEGTVVFDGVLQVNDASVRANAEQVKQNLPMLFTITTLPVILWISGAVLLVAGLVVLAFTRLRAAVVIGAVLAVTIGAGVASGTTVTVTNLNNPDTELDLRNAVSSGGVDYGVR